MNFYHETFKTWDKIAELYQDKFMGLDIYDKTYDYFSDSISKSPGKILDVGCGPGNITKYLMSKRSDFQIDGIDIAPNMVRLAKENNPSANFRVMDSRRINEINVQYDGIICGFCLPYLSEADCAKLISDAYQLIRDDGLIYINFVAGDSAKSRYQMGNSGDRVYFYYHSLEAISDRLQAIGFENTSLFQVDYTKSETDQEVHTILIATKIITPES